MAGSCELFTIYGGAHGATVVEINQALRTADKAALDAPLRALQVNGPPDTFSGIPMEAFWIGPVGQTAMPPDDDVDGEGVLYDDDGPEGDDGEYDA